MRRKSLAIVLVLSLAFASLGGRSSAVLSRPAYRVGDFWAYATNLTEDLGLAFDGTSRVEVVRFGSLSVQGSQTPIAELLVTGSGTFSGAAEGIGTVAGTWTITGTEAWETGAWKSVRSFFRLTAEGMLTGPTPLAFTLSVTNDTTRRSLSDDWAWPLEAGTTGSWASHWNASQNITVSVQGVPAAWNASSFDADHSIDYEYVRTETITVPAGAFPAHVLREESPGSGSRLRWYVPDVGNDVRQEEYNETGGRVARAELLDYAYATSFAEPSAPWWLALNAALVGVAIVLLVALAVRRRKRGDVRIPSEPSVEKESEKLSP